MKIEFVGSDGWGGRAKFNYDVKLAEKYDPHAAKINRCELHAVEGDFAPLKLDLDKHRTKEKDPANGQDEEGAWVYIRVTGEDASTQESNWYFLVLDDASEVTRFWEKK